VICDYGSALIRVTAQNLLPKSLLFNIPLTTVICDYGSALIRVTAQNLLPKSLHTLISVPST
jgi:hypothetical protein